MSAELARVAHVERLLVALDFDGTLAPLVVEPMSARMLPEARETLQRLSQLPGTVIALVSGRSLADLRVISEWTEDAPFLLSGSHGAEFSFGTSPLAGDEREEVALMTARLREALAAWPDVLVEAKTLGVAVHSRGLPDEVEAEVFALAREFFASHAPAWRVREGDRIVEFAITGSGKDDALRVLLDAIGGADGIFFAGDDVTDEDALRFVASHFGGSGLGVRIAPAGTVTHAGVRVDAASDVVALLDALATERAGAQS